MSATLRSPADQQPSVLSRPLTSMLLAVAGFGLTSFAWPGASQQGGNS